MLLTLLTRLFLALFPKRIALALTARIAEHYGFTVEGDLRAEDGTVLGRMRLDGNADSRVVVLYDQSGGGNHAVQRDVSKAPTA